ncbi:MAG: endolytic transglycosylase MltG [Anaerolineales bacterium]|nr:MAG: endolytic transglycosylase MltG [Anaerolineales bacterium]
MRRYQYYFILALLVLASLACVFAFLYYIPAQASLLYGPPASHLSISNRIEYSARLLMHGDRLITPRDPNGIEQPFHIEGGEPVSSIANRLEELGFISSADAFFDYVVYSGIDLTIQAGDFTLSPALSIVKVAQTLQKFSPGDASLVILPGWRMEEIAASLPTSGLSIDPQTFLAAAQTPSQVLAFASPATMEGFFYPDTYTLPRETTVDQLLDAVARNFVVHISGDLQEGFASQGLSLYQAVILASIVEREAIRAEESALIASVYLNRLAIGMKLDADPTVQYALGYRPDTNSWWKSPLFLNDLQVSSSFNTYQIGGLPPAPISNPGLEALQAVAFPQASPYYYFRAACDGSGYHVFAVTLEEQIANACP